MTLTAWGLLLDIAGASLLFFYGPPQPDLEPGVALGLENGNVLADGRTVAELNAARYRLRRRHRLFSRLALSLIVAGFVLQFVGSLPN
jgi:hypothetical protein